MSLMTIFLLPGIRRSKRLNLKFTAIPMKMNRLILVDVNRHSVKPVKFLQNIKFQHQGLITLSTKQTSKISLSIYRFTIKIYLSVLPHFLYDSSQVFKFVTHSQIILRDSVVALSCSFCLCVIHHFWIIYRISSFKIITFSQIILRDYLVALSWNFCFIVILTSRIKKAVKVTRLHEGAVIKNTGFQSRNSISTSLTLILYAWWFLHLSSRHTLDDPDSTDRVITPSPDCVAQASLPRRLAPSSNVASSSSQQMRRLMHCTIVVINSHLLLLLSLLDFRLR